jgi:hypothetical protein
VSEETDKDRDTAEQIRHQMSEEAKSSKPRCDFYTKPNCNASWLYIHASLLATDARFEELQLTQPPLQARSQATRLPLQAFNSCIVNGLR